MSYSIYFNWHPTGGKGDVYGRKLWHPVDLPQLTKEQAEKAALALSKALPEHSWAYGPTFQEGIKEVTRSEDETNR